MEFFADIVSIWLFAYNNIKVEAWWYLVSFVWVMTTAKLLISLPPKPKQPLTSFSMFLSSDIGLMSYDYNGLLGTSSHDLQIMWEIQKKRFLDSDCASLADWSIKEYRYQNS